MFITAYHSQQAKNGSNPRVHEQINCDIYIYNGLLFSHKKKIPRPATT
jgi:hypothetical protein